jgi:hypothetical protein
MATEGVDEQLDIGKSLDDAAGCGFVFLVFSISLIAGTIIFVII